MVFRSFPKKRVYENQDKENRYGWNSGWMLHKQIRKESSGAHHKEQRERCDSPHASPIGPLYDRK
jgi:hypothetical protein